MCAREREREKEKKGKREREREKARERERWTFCAYPSDSFASGVRFMGRMRCQVLSGRMMILRILVMMMLMM